MLQNAIIAQRGSANFPVDVSIDACSHIAIIPFSGKTRAPGCSLLPTMPYGMIAAQKFSDRRQCGGRSGRLL
jgi:hypothetical protein